MSPTSPPFDSKVCRKLLAMTNIECSYACGSQLPEPAILLRVYFGPPSLLCLNAEEVGRINNYINKEINASWPPRSSPQSTSVGKLEDKYPSGGITSSNVLHSLP